MDCNILDIRAIVLSEDPAVRDNSVIRIMVKPCVPTHFLSVSLSPSLATWASIYFLLLLTLLPPCARLALHMLEHYYRNYVVTIIDDERGARDTREVCVTLMARDKTKRLTVNVIIFSFLFF